VALPRVRDFRGVPAKAFDGEATLGIRDHLIFRNRFNKVDKAKGMNVTFVTTTANDEQAMPLRKLGISRTQRGQENGEWRPRPVAKTRRASSTRSASVTGASDVGVRAFLRKFALSDLFAISPARDTCRA
jgi:hypothetical protein